MKLKNKILWEKLNDSCVTGYERTIIRSAENLAELTEKKMGDGLEFKKAISESWEEAILKSGIQSKNDDMYEKMTSESVDILFETWEYGKMAKEWFEDTIADRHF